ncbi:YmfQ family protein [Neisseria sp. S1]|uniref:YmfQ family protein n=1 Tax=Neisseria sp. S1 TaxID=3318354 RepID=UPI003A83848D
MGYQDTLLALLPPVSYARNTDGQRNQAAIDANVLDAADAAAEIVVNAITPDLADSLIDNWERVLGLDNSDKPYTYRVDAAIAKINAIGGLSIPYFVNLAAGAGYDIHITEEDQFRAGESCAGDELNDELSQYRWCVDIADGKANAYIFRAGESRAGERISVFADPILETMFEELKPAWTSCRFVYTEEA